MLNTKSFRLGAHAVLAASMGIWSGNAAALIINLSDTGGAAAGSAAGDAFRAAADIWEGLLGDAVTVNIDVGFASLGSGILGQAASTRAGVSYSNAKTALAADATSTDDATAIAALPGGTSLSFRTTEENGTAEWDNDASADNRFLDVTTANLKALGLIDANLAATDGSIVFNSDYSFDFDPNDGISSSAYDFTGVALHEIGHALGFVSGVDVVDFYASTDLDSYRVFSVLDLYRYGDQTTGAAHDPGGAQLDYRPGAAAYFSIDGGATSLGTFSTGKYNGDGRQASHWKDNLGLGLMDPTFAAGETGSISSLDLLALDVIGWDLASASTVDVPPSTWLLISGLVVLGRVRSASRTKS